MARQDIVECYAAALAPHSPLYSTPRPTPPHPTDTETEGPRIFPISLYAARDRDRDRVCVSDRGNGPTSQKPLISFPPTKYCTHPAMHAQFKHDSASAELPFGGLASSCRARASGRASLIVVAWSTAPTKRSSIQAVKVKVEMKR